MGEELAEIALDVEQVSVVLSSQITANEVLVGLVGPRIVVLIGSPVDSFVRCESDGDQDALVELLEQSALGFSEFDENTASDS